VEEEVPPVNELVTMFAEGVVEGFMMFRSV
jgi:hypothetical protein